MAWPRFSCTAGRALWWTLGRRLPLMQSQPRASISEESSRRDWELLRRLCLHEQRNCRAWKSKTREKLLARIRSQTCRRERIIARGTLWTGNLWGGEKSWVKNRGGGGGRGESKSELKGPRISETPRTL